MWGKEAYEVVYVIGAGVSKYLNKLLCSICLTVKFKRNYARKSNIHSYRDKTSM